MEVPGREREININFNASMALGWAVVVDGTDWRITHGLDIEHRGPHNKPS